jgi:CRP-like cAMP-binding protein
MSDGGILGTFAGHAFLRDLSERHRMLLACGARPFSVAAGEVFAREGDTAKAFFLIQSGRVTLSARVGPRGNVPVQVVGPGEVVGWSWLVPPHHWQFEARADEPVRGIAFDAAWLREKCEQDNSLGYALLQHLVVVLAGRLAATRRQLLEPHKG